MYQYNGKELVEDNGLGWNHYGARAYDPAVGRWWVVDPMAEIAGSESSYTFGSCSPSNNIDIGGLFTFPDAAEYPIFSKMLQESLPRMLGKGGALRNGLMAIGGFSDEQIEKEMLVFGEGYEIQVSAAPNGYQDADGYTPEAGKIVINVELLRQLENASPENQKAAFLAVMSTVFHETIHTGELKNPFPVYRKVGSWEKKGYNIYRHGSLIGHLDGHPGNSVSRTFSMDGGRALENGMWGVPFTKRGDYINVFYNTYLRETKKNKDSEEEDEWIKP